MCAKGTAECVHIVRINRHQKEYKEYINRRSSRNFFKEFEHVRFIISGLRSYAVVNGTWTSSIERVPNAIDASMHIYCTSVQCELQELIAPLSF